MTNVLVTKLQNLATATETHVSAEVRELTPKLRAAAEDIVHKLDAWLSAVDDWEVKHFPAQEEAVKKAASAAYQDSLKAGHALYEDVKAKV
jgi:hypothetical protein